MTSLYNPLNKRPVYQGVLTIHPLNVLRSDLITLLNWWFELVELRFELVKSMLPAEHHKVLANIRKVEARTKRRKLLNDDEEESDSEENSPKAKTDR